MNMPIRQQIVISGYGGQGVLFITRLIAETAIIKGLPVLTSETHGMAQRGGTVISHLKVGEFSSPLIRRSTADGLLALRSENLVSHRSYLRPDAWAVINEGNNIKTKSDMHAFTIDADNIALKINNPKSVNLILLGFTIAATSSFLKNRNNLFCSREDIKTVLENRFGKHKEMLSSSIKAFEIGYNSFAKG